MDDEAFGRAAMQLVDAVREIFEAEVAKNTACAGQLRRVLALMAELRPAQDRGEPTQYPACRHLSRALDLAAAGPAAAVAAALRELEPALAWAQNPRYNVENKGADFMDNYAWSGLGLAGSDKMSFGVLLLGPGVTYPPTSYESEGVFLVISGAPEWKSADEPWVRVEPGTVVCRPYGGSEGKRPGNEPMLALYAWMYR
ncbi:MAG: dimethylsulfonioproprionate lyase family protein [Gammaproteobacteria bacterium]|nr:dimethylsulfonioproprionate lyase family protein [Gammaproteobacteria bacterium]